MSTALSADLGNFQGRIRPTNWTPLNGEYVFCLGHDLPGQTYSLPTGLLVSVAQTFDNTGFNSMQFSLHIRAPVSIPVGYTWVCEVFTFGGPQLTVEFTDAEAFQERTYLDVAVPTYGESIVELAVMLTLAGPSSPIDAELPAVYVDAAISANNTPDSMVSCRSPAPDAMHIWPSRPIEFQAFALDGSGLASVSIFVNGDLIAVLGGSNASVTSFIAAGWTIQTSVLAFTDAVTTYTLTPQAGWLSQSTVSVTALVTTGSNKTRGHQWQFTIADTAGPRMSSATAIGVYTIMVEWNETISDDSLNPEYFRIIAPPLAAALNVVDVQRDSELTERIIVYIDQPATPGATYTIIASRDVTDLVGNQVELEYESAQFMTYSSPLTPENRELLLYKELPAAERDTDQLGELDFFCAVLDEALRALIVVADDWPLIVTDPDTAGEPWLDLMLWDLGNPFEWLPLDIPRKRLLVRWMDALVALKGSGIGIRAAIRFLLGIEVQVHVYAWGPEGLGSAVMGESWILGSDDEDDAYTFWVIVDEQLDEETRQYMNRIIEIMKVAHERHLIVEPDQLIVPDHWQLGFSLLGLETELHA